MTTTLKRYGKVIGLKTEKLEEYKRLHAAVWPGVNAMISACHIRNFTIFLRKMAADPTTQQWWKFTDPCQDPLADRRPGEWWAEMEEVCHNP